MQRLIGEGGPIYRGGRINLDRRGGGSPPPALVLDSLSAGAAYSTRRLRTAYTGPALRVRRSSDNVEQDIGFSGNSLNTTALTSFIGSNSGFVVTWYDQSGNGRHVTNADPAQQPRIVNAGAVETQNGAPSFFFNGTSHHLFNTTPFMYAAGSATVCAVVSGAGVGCSLVSESSAASNNPCYLHGTSQAISADAAVFYRNDTSTQFVGFNVTILANAFDSIMRPIQWVDTGSSVNVFRNGASGTAQAYTRSGALTLNRFTVGAMMRTTTSFFFPGYISEVICFAAALSTSDRATVDANQAAAFPI